MIETAFPAAAEALRVYVGTFPGVVSRAPHVCHRSKHLLQQYSSETKTPIHICTTSYILWIVYCHWN